MHTYLLKNYVDALQEESLLIEVHLDHLLLSQPIDCVTYDTRELYGTSLFICKGAHFKEEYLSDALSHGSIAYISDHVIGNSLNYVLVSDIRMAIAVLSELHFDHAPSEVTSIGITGTKGKSTTAYYVRAILDDWMESMDKNRCAVISSIDTYDGVINEESHITTPESLAIHRHFRHAADSGISHLVMEVSSQGLKYQRMEKILLDVGAFLNIGNDHISPIEHPDFEDYFASKLKIFDYCKTGCINTDIPQSQQVLEAARGKCSIITFGSHESDDIYCSNIEKKEDGTYFTVHTSEFTDTFCLTMPGLFNVSNALCAIAICTALGVPKTFMISGLKRAKAGGRMQVYTSKDKKIIVIVDYAHNRLSFEALFQSVEIEYPNRYTTIVFGCPGCKALLRRSDLGEIAGKHANYVYITEEDSGEEPFESIASDIEKAVDAQGCPHTVLEDRGECIRRAILEGPMPKLVLLTGKGEETRMKRGMQYVDFPSDVEFTLRYLKEYDQR